MKSKAYKICLITLLFFVGYPVLATIGTLSLISLLAEKTEYAELPARVEELDDKRSCHIGIKVCSASAMRYVMLMAFMRFRSFGCELIVESVTSDNGNGLLAPHNRSIPQIIYDVFLALLLAVCFLYPLRR